MTRFGGRHSRTLAAVAPLVLLVLLGTNACANGGAVDGSAVALTRLAGCQPPRLPAWTVRYHNDLWVGVCGPTNVARNTTHTYEIVVKNFTRSSGPVRLWMIHYDPITSNSIPYRRAYNRTDGELETIWILHHFKPFQVRRVKITLPIKQHNDPKGSNLVVRAWGRGRNEHGSYWKDINFVG